MTQSQPRGPKPAPAQAAGQEDPAALAAPGAVGRGRVPPQVRDWRGPTTVLLVWGVVALIALVPRVAVLGQRPLHHDEAVHARYAYDILQGFPYRYNPAYHGPLQFDLLALAQVFLGDSDIAARIPAAVVGALSCGLLLWLRAGLGPVGLIAALAAALTSPLLLYYHRFAREDVYVSAAVTGMLVALFAAARAVAQQDGQQRALAWAIGGFLASVALWFIAKESAVVGVAIAVSGLVVVAIISRVGGQWWTRSPGVEVYAASVLAGRVLQSFWSGLRLAWPALFLSIGAAVLFYSNGGTYPQGVLDSVIRPYTFWLGRHGDPLLQQPLTYYLIQFLTYEHLTLVLALVGLVMGWYAWLRRAPESRGIRAARSRRRGGRDRRVFSRGIMRVAQLDPQVQLLTFLTLLCVWWVVLMLGFLLWAGEKAPWLLLHALPALHILAGCAAAWLWRWQEHLSRGVVVAVVVLGAASSGWQAYLGTFGSHPAAIEPLTLCQPGAAPRALIQELVSRMAVLPRASAGTQITMLADAVHLPPFFWYLRHVDDQVRYAELNTPDDARQLLQTYLDNPGHRFLAVDLAWRELVDTGLHDRGVAGVGRVEPMCSWFGGLFPSPSAPVLGAWLKLARQPTWWINRAVPAPLLPPREVAAARQSGTVYLYLWEKS